jgi:Tfp pilus assembly protein PilN
MDAPGDGSRKRPPLYVTGPAAHVVWRAAPPERRADLRLGDELYGWMDPAMPAPSIQNRSEPLESTAGSFPAKGDPSLFWENTGLLPPAFGMGVGLAMAGLFAGTSRADGISRSNSNDGTSRGGDPPSFDAASNLLGGPGRAGVTDEVGRTDAMRVALAALIVVCIVLGGIFALQTGLDAKLAQTEAALVEQAGEVREVEAAEAATERDRKRLRRAQAIEAGRTQAYTVLRQVAAQAPADLWLTRFDVERPDPEAPLTAGEIARGRLQGLTRSETAPVRYVQALSDRAGGLSPELVVAERLSPAAVQRLGVRDGISLLAFEIRITAPLTPALDRPAGGHPRPVPSTEPPRPLDR